MSLAKKAVVPALLAAAFGGGLGAWYALRPGKNNPGVVRVSGNIEVTDAEVGFKIPGRVIERRVDEGQKVRKDQVIALLDSKDLEAERDMRAAELRLADAAERELRESRPEEIQAAYAAWQRAEAAYQDLKAEAGSREHEIQAAEAAQRQARAELDRCELDFGRATTLLKNKTISKEEYDRAETALEVAREQYREASARLDQLKSGFREKETQADWARKQAEWEYKLVKEGPRKEKHEQAVARRDQAAAALRLAEIRVEYATLHSPLNGIVLSKNIERGEYVAPGTPVVTVGDLDNVWLRAYIDETDVGRVKPGQKAVVRTDTRPDREYQGYVAFVSQEAEFTPKTVQTPKERVRLVYRIKINVDKRENPDMELLPGMPADAEIVLE